MLEEILKSLSPWKGRKIVVAMSGGVDSSLSAALLHLAGARVIGIHMRVWHYDHCQDQAGLASCCSPADTLDARRLADQFGFPFYSIDFQENFRKAVIEPFIKDYLSGLTPNPCVHCNNQLKLGTLLAKATAYGAEAVATGHYGRVTTNSVTGRAELRCSADRAKDQTYYLFGLLQPQLSRLVMPLGEITKTQARSLARDLDLQTHDKPDSVEICFVTDNDYRRFLREEAGLDETALSGAIVDTQGRILGRHQGIHNFTIGQRKGLKLAAPRPLYVVDLIPETQSVVVGFEEELLAGELEIERINWVGLAPQREPFRARVKIRYRSPGELATVYPVLPTGLPTEEKPAAKEQSAATGNTVDQTESRMPRPPSRARVCFDAPVRAITPGQAAVAYDEATGGLVLAGGWISRNRKSEV